MRAIQLTTGPELDFLQLRYCADAHVLAARWQRPVTPAELRHGYTATLEAAESVSCPYWLVDLRGRTAPDVHGAHWLSAEFLPRVPRHLGGAVYVGLLLPPHYDSPSTCPTATWPLRKPRGSSRCTGSTRKGPSPSGWPSARAGKHKAREKVGAESRKVPATPVAFCSTENRFYG